MNVAQHRGSSNRNVAKATSASNDSEQYNLALMLASVKLC